MTIVAKLFQYTCPHLRSHGHHLTPYVQKKGAIRKALTARTYIGLNPMP
jgi:hypothetical protein